MTGNDPNGAPPPTGAVGQLQAAVTQLEAEVLALQGWRAHQTDVLDAIINSDVTPHGTPSDEPDSGRFVPWPRGHVDDTHADGYDDSDDGDDFGGVEERDEGAVGHSGIREVGALIESANAAGRSEVRAGVEPTPTVATTELVEWVDRHVAAVIARPLRGEMRWCARWWEHPEAVVRLTGLQRAWEEMAGEPGAGLSIYLRDHLDPCLRELTHPLGTFSDCSQQRTRHSTGHGSGQGSGPLVSHTPVPVLPSTEWRAAPSRSPAVSRRPDRRR